MGNINHIKAGRFAINIWERGSPIWCQLYADDEEILAGIDSRELDDLEYVIKKARKVIAENRDA